MRVCKKAGENALCFAQQTHYHGPADGDGEKKAIEQSSTTPSSHPRLIFSLPFSLASLSFVLPLLLFPLLYFHLLSLTFSLPPLPFSRLSKLVIFVVDLCHLYDFCLVYL